MPPLNQGVNPMLRISKLTDYATMIMSYLAHDPTEVVSATRVASAIHLSAPTVSKILKILSEAHLVKSFRGTGGGYQLARSAKDITMAEVVSALEGKVAMTECCATSTCALDRRCGMKENWRMINRMIMTALSGLTLLDMTKPLHSHPLMLKGIPVKVKQGAYG